MSELINFRDFGGLETEDGRRIKEKIFYRSGSYRDLLDTDRKMIQGLNINHLFDYREDQEVDIDEKQHELAVTFHQISASAHLGGFDNGDKDRYVHLTADSMIDFYKKLPFENPAYINLFDVLQRDDATPMLHNCTAGKDRTGVATALIQKVLGAKEDEIFYDYMRSMDAFEAILRNEYRRLNGKSEEAILYKVSGLVIMPSYLQAAFDAIIDKYGDFETYYLQEFGLTEEKILDLRDKYTE
ncbi:MAG TPA: tyrosine-protein phosphatase [Erysipelothrix sp.]